MADGFELDRAGIAEVLKVTSAEVIAELTAAIAAEAGPDATHKVVTTDRAHGQVAVPAIQQARDGVLTRAANAVGLEVHSKDG